MTTNINYDELFAQRIYLQDEFENESDIIKELKYILLDKGISNETIPNILKDFYEHFGINITIEQINEALIEGFPNQIMNMFNTFIHEINHTPTPTQAPENGINNELPNPEYIPQQSITQHLFLTMGANGVMQFQLMPNTIIQPIQQTQPTEDIQTQPTEDIQIQPTEDTQTQPTEAPIINQQKRL
jgi:uncharacterized protein YdiU (UPF0061 family)